MIDPDIKAKALAELRCGGTPRIVAQRFGLSVDTVRRWHDQGEDIDVPLRNRRGFRREPADLATIAVPGVTRAQLMSGK